MLYQQENVDGIGAQDALQTVINTAAMTAEYMTAMERAPKLQATGLEGDYRILADFGDAVLAGHPSERGVRFVTWEWDWDCEGVHHGHYFQNGCEEAKHDFVRRGGLLPKEVLFEPEQLAEIFYPTVYCVLFWNFSEVIVTAECFMAYHCRNTYLYSGS